MNKTLKAADEVKKLHRMFQSLGEVVEVLDRIGSVEQAEQEARARVEAANREADAIKGMVDDAKAKAKAIKDASDKLEQEASQHIEILKAAAHDEATAIVAEAKGEADKLIEAARVQVEAAESRAQACAIDVEVKTKELAELDAKIAKAQAQINKILGG